MSQNKSTHDIHHLVLGVDTSVAGEAAASAYYAVSQKMAGSIVPLASYIFMVLSTRSISAD